MSSCEFIKFEKAYRTFTETESFTKIVAIETISSIACFGPEYHLHIKLTDGEDFFADCDLSVLEGIIVPHVLEPSEEDECSQIN